MAENKIPILLLKTKSTPGDAYQDIFSQPHNGLSFYPSFVPVLEHTFDEQGLANIGSVLESRQIGSRPGACYGGLIFTSQRAVEAFTKLILDGQGKTCFAPDSFPSRDRFPAHNGSRVRTRMAVCPRCASIQRGPSND